ncbi:MAG: alpha/beta hydrolase [Clostridia bacterium]|nr:alpha/beta hydrolase [Clostridia bacterium]
MHTIKTIPYNPLLTGLAESTGDIVFAHEDNKDVTLRILKPWKNDLNKDNRYPLIVFIQGSGWTFPNIGYHLPHIAQLAMKGYVVATVTHRSSNDGHPFPAFLQDTKSAIRYLRAHAEEHQIDPERVAAWGTSSGGNTALLLGLTGDDPRYVSSVHPEQSDAVKAVVDVFGPTDMMSLFTGRHGDYETAQLDPGAEAYYNRILGHAWNTPAGLEAANAMSPLQILHEGMKLPPMQLLYGDADPIVPFDQGVRMFDKLCAMGYDADFVRISGAEHEGNFWSQAVLDEIFAYIAEKV